MTTFKVTEDGEAASGAKTFTVTIDGDGKGENLSKLDAMIKLRTFLDVTREEWQAILSEVQKLKD